MKPHSHARVPIVCLILVSVIGLTSCSKDRPEQRLEFPTQQHLAAKPNAVGVPYDRFIVLRYDQRTVALKLRAFTELGDRVQFEWYAGNDRGGFSAETSSDKGEGETVERPHTGRIPIPGMPLLVWSRSSQDSGWIYWPENDQKLEFYSLAFADLGGIDLHHSSGNWIQRGSSNR